MRRLRSSCGVRVRPRSSDLFRASPPSRCWSPPSSRLEPEPSECARIPRRFQALQEEVQPCHTAVRSRQWANRHAASIMILSPAQWSVAKIMLQMPLPVVLKT